MSAPSREANKAEAKSQGMVWDGHEWMKGKAHEKKKGMAKKMSGHFKPENNPLNGVKVEKHPKTNIGKHIQMMADSITKSSKY